MAVHLGTHPSADVLKAFGQGKLDDTAIGTVMDHLDLCADCRKVVSSQSGDGFLDRLRQAHGRSSTPAPAKGMSPSVAGPKPPETNPSAIPNLPPELANNQKYEILRELGRGGMGVVYLAKNKLMDRLEVLKVVNKTLLDRPGSVERFLREIRSAAKLSHANVVGAYSAVQQGELLAFAMEYVEGEDLAAVVKTQGPLPVAHACFYVQQAALGLQHAFEKKMVHRDIKPQNLILAREGKKHIVKVLDFGLAKVMREKTDDTGLTGEGKMLGTPDYIAPEQTLDAASADIRADIYSLGCTLYFLLSGRPPFSANSLGAILLAHQMKESKPLNLVRAEVPEELASVVRKMMAKSVAKRYQTPLEVVQALSPFVKQGASQKSSPDLSVGTAKAAGVKVAKPVVPPVLDSSAKQLPPQEVPPVAWESMTEGSITSAQPRRSGTVRKHRSPAVNAETKKKWLLGGGIGVGVLLLALLGMWASGVFKVKTKDGILVVEVNEPNPDVYVDGEKVTVSWDKGGKKAEIRIKPGTRRVEVKKDGFVVDGKELAFKDGDREVFTARLLPEKRVAKADAPPPANVPPKPDTPKPEPEKPETEKPDVTIAPVDSGFMPLFNGKDLTGWIQSNRQPAAWRVFDGVLEVVPGKGNIMTTENYGPDFQLHAEFNVPLYADRKGQARGNSGIFLLGNYEIQILDSYDNPQPPERACAALYGIIGPSRNVCKPPNEWQTYDITFRSPRLDANKKVVQSGELTVVHNGVVVIDKGKFDSPIGGGLSQDAVTTGPIVLQDHGSAVRFRKLLIKPLDAEPNPKRTDKTEFVPLFNGKDTTGWSVDGGPPGQWSVEGNTIIGQSKHYSTRNYLLTDKEYTDFVLRFDYKVEDESHGGVGIRAIEGEKMPYNNRLLFDHPLIKLTNPAMEEKEPTGTTNWLKSAAAYVRPLEVIPLPTRTWHSMEVVVRGDNCTATVGGKKLVNVTLDRDLRDNGTFVPGLGRRKGKVGFQINTGVVRYRKIEIKELSAAKSEAPAADPSRLPLFNGKDLSGWHGMPNFDPYKLAAMSKAERKAKIEEWTEDAKKHWKIENGELVNDGQGAYLTTDEEYDDIELFLDYKIAPGADSGIYLRGTPQVQIWDWTDKTKWTDGADKGSGGLWNNTKGTPGKDPLVRADRLCGEWNQMRILQIGARTTVWLNDKLVVDNAVMENYWDRKKPLLAKGPIQLQAHTGETRFRNLFVRPIPLAEANAWKEQHNAEGFVPLFNGKDLKGWRVHSRQRGNWRVEKGVLIGSGPAVSHLYSSRGNYKNFHLRVEARINDGGNSGVYFRTGFGPAVPANKPTFPLGYEAQIYNAKPGDMSQTGSLYAGIGAPVVNLRESPVRSGEWFILETIAVGNHLVIKVDGKTTVDYRDDKRLFTTGYLALQQLDAQTVAEFRKIEIKELPTTPATK